MKKASFKSATTIFRIPGKLNERIKLPFNASCEEIELLAHKKPRFNDLLASLPEAIERYKRRLRVISSELNKLDITKASFNNVMSTATVVKCREILDRLKIEIAKVYLEYQENIIINNKYRDQHRNRLELDVKNKLKPLVVFYKNLEGAIVEFEDKIKQKFEAIHKINNAL